MNPVDLNILLKYLAFPLLWELYIMSLGFFPVHGNVLKWICLHHNSTYVYHRCLKQRLG